MQCLNSQLPNPETTIYQRVLDYYCVCVLWC
uniref:Uncharacterized protein n=1 Tax=Anguilla anguilla TaxID=7936 RepID=A0A0E9Q0E3_ANGAN